MRKERDHLCTLLLCHVVQLISFSRGQDLSDWISWCGFPLVVGPLPLLAPETWENCFLGWFENQRKNNQNLPLKKWRDESHHAESTSQAINQNATKTKVCPHSKTWNTEYTMSFSRLKIVKWFTPLPKATNPRGKKKHRLSCINMLKTWSSIFSTKPGLTISFETRFFANLIHMEKHIFSLFRGKISWKPKNACKSERIQVWYKPFMFGKL